jgi:predicted permease
MHDLRQAFRSLRKQRGFALVVIVTLALGIGVNVSLFSLVSTFFLQPLNVKNPHELVLVTQRSEAINLAYGHSYPDYRDYREAVTSFSELVAYSPMPAHLSAPGRTPERTWIEAISPNYFTLAGVSPAFGEFPRPGRDEQQGAAPTAVLSYRYWQHHFGGDPSLVGRPITINGRSFTVLGIAPAEFTGLSWAMAVSAFIPSGAMGALTEDGEAFRDNRGAPAWRLVGRLAPGKTIHDARAELEVVSKRLAAEYPAEHEGSRVAVIPENRARPDPSVSDFLPVFAVVFAAMVTLVLSIACANVANLMVSRAVQRQRDLVIRSALGASRFRLMRLQLAESLLLAASAGLLGLALAYWIGEALVAFMPIGGDIPVVEERPTDWRVYVFTFVISGVAGIATGFWPARRATRFDLVEALKDGGSVAGASRHVFRNLLVIGQVTLSLVVLIGAALFVNSMRQMQHLALGFTPDRLLIMSVDLGLQQYGDERGSRFLEDLMTRAEALPGVERATVVNHVPFDYGIQLTDIATDEEIPGSKDGYISSAYNIVGHSFFETTGSVLMRGRVLDRTDDARSRRVAVVNETMARKLWPKQDAIGRRFRFGRNGPWLEVVGVVRDGKYVMIAEEPRTYFYVPLAQQYRSPMTLMVRSTAEPVTLVTSLRRLLGEMDPNLPVFNVKTMREHVRESVFGLMPVRVGASIAGMQGLIALLLAVMGLYAVVAQAVARRVREIGVRMALGAAPGDVLRLVLREGMTLSAIGIAIGLPIAMGIGFGLSHVLFGVAAFDIGVFAGVTILLALVTALACYVPARRATRVDPLIALRYE